MIWYSMYGHWVYTLYSRMYMYSNYCFTKYVVLPIGVKGLKTIATQSCFCPDLNYVIC